ncbi:histidinol-phosphate transaminase [Kitasatospora sp. NPDC097643]|uniref:histidinol-phosphate transaminase n=1 Tax=Kitasatospora sp. NPDC097643 TaxID=3157230 RepID=UPI00331EB86C
MTSPAGTERGPGLAGPRLRPDLGGLPRFRGRPADAGMIALDSNESPFGPPTAVLDAIAAAAAGSHRYPDNSAAELTARLAERYRVAPECVSLGAGSVSLCLQLIQIACAAGDEVLVPWRSFEVYPALAGIAGAVVRQVPLTARHTLDLPAMAAAITDRTRLVFVCSPNNPTGTALSRTEVERFIAEVPPQVLIVLDEAYAEFAAGPDPLDGVGLVRERLRQGRGNVVALRTFSKAYGLAGLRVGYCVSAEPVADLLGRVAVPYAVTALAQRAALAALDGQPELLRRARWIAGERDRVRTALLDGGWEVPESAANFLWLPIGSAAVPFAGHCRDRRVLVRAFPDEGVRVTVGSAAENAALLAAAQSFAGAVPVTAAGRPASSRTSWRRTS